MEFKRLIDVSFKGLTKFINNYKVRGQLCIS